MYDVDDKIDSIKEMEREKKMEKKEYLPDKTTSRPIEIWEIKYERLHLEVEKLKARIAKLEEGEL